MELRKIWAIAVREFGNFFVSPVVYAVLTVFLFLNGFFLTSSVVNLQKARFSLDLILFTFIFLAPLLTMRLIALERKQGTVELIFTSPVSALDLVFGKYLGVLGVYGVAILLSFELPVYLLAVGDPDPLVMATQYLGMVLVGSAFLAVGLFCSALTENQVVSAVSSFFILLFFWLISPFSRMLPTWMRPTFEAFDIASRMQNFQQGVLVLDDVVFLLALIAGFLYATVTYLNTRSWRQ